MYADIEGWHKFSLPHEQWDNFMYTNSRWQNLRHIILYMQVNPLNHDRDGGGDRKDKWRVDAKRKIKGKEERDYFFGRDSTTLLEGSQVTPPRPCARNNVTVTKSRWQEAASDSGIWIYNYLAIICKRIIWLYPQHGVILVNLKSRKAAWEAQSSFYMFNTAKKMQRVSTTKIYRFILGGIAASNETACISLFFSLQVRPFNLRSHPELHLFVTSLCGIICHRVERSTRKPWNMTLVERWSGP